MSPALAPLLSHMAAACSQCGLCQRQCLFLQRHGNPGQIAAAFQLDASACQRLPFECHLCGLCTALCPLKLDPASMFLAMRQTSPRRHAPAYDNHCMYLGYEARGISHHLSFHALPAGCDTVFFPGCSLPATRPQTTWKLFEALRRTTPALGFVLDCCTKPSHDLGRQEFFAAAFGELHNLLAGRGIRRVLVACPNCYKIFSQHSHGLAVETVYERLAAEGFAARSGPAAAVALHDPCVLRFQTPIQQAVRELLRRSAMAIEELPHHGENTICCGLGASVGCADPRLAEGWRALRLREAGGRPLVTYCAGCAERLRAPQQPSAHILDCLFDPDAAGRARRPSPPFPWTCLNRTRLKTKIRREFKAAVTASRPRRQPRLGGARLNRNRTAYWISYAVTQLLGG